MGGAALGEAVVDACWRRATTRPTSAAKHPLPLNIAAEVQLIYRPYLDRGRKLSHLLYKVVRCLFASELSRDAGGKRAVSEEKKAAARVCGAIVGEGVARLA